MSLHELGQQAQDKITGYAGIITARVHYLTGCTQYGLTAPMKDGEIKGTEYFDEGRIEIVGPGMNAESVSAPAAGGPNRDAPPR